MVNVKNIIIIILFVIDYPFHHSFQCVSYLYIYIEEHTIYVMLIRRIRMFILTEILYIYIMYNR